MRKMRPQLGVRVLHPGLVVSESLDRRQEFASYLGEAEGGVAQGVLWGCVRGSIGLLSFKVKGSGITGFTS